MKWQAVSPSNLALIKYMGKHPPENSQDDNFKKNDLNLALNPSISYTLNHFLSCVRVQESSKDHWKAFTNSPFEYHNKIVSYASDPDFEKQKLYYSENDPHLTCDLSETNQKKFLSFFEYLKKIFFISGDYELNSANNFPLSAGVASSASSFSALTLATYELAKEKSSNREFIDSLTVSDLSEIARLGSGSACRSFFSPWAIWQGRYSEKYPCPLNSLIHQLLIVDDASKTVSSREAHKKVLSSPHFEKRLDRVQQRLDQLFQSLQSQNWTNCFQICWDEFQDMHQLFETSNPSFSYRNKTSLETLNKLQEFWKENNDGPLVTMDAGANIHLLYRPDQKTMARDIESLFSHLKVFSSDIERS